MLFAMKYPFHVSWKKKLKEKGIATKWVKCSVCGDEYESRVDVEWCGVCLGCKYLGPPTKEDRDNKNLWKECSTVARRRYIQACLDTI